MYQTEFMTHAKADWLKLVPLQAAVSELRLLISPAKLLVLVNAEAHTEGKNNKFKVALRSWSQRVGMFFPIMGIELLDCLFGIESVFPTISL